MPDIDIFSLSEALKQSASSKKCRKSSLGNLGLRRSALRAREMPFGTGVHVGGRQEKSPSFARANSPHLWCQIWCNVQAVSGSGLGKCMCMSPIHLFILVLILRLEVLAQTQDELTEELVKSRGKFRKKERQWINEKEVFLRKLQFIQHYGCDQAPDEAGFYTGQRSIFRLGGEHQLRRRIEKITVGWLPLNKTSPY